MDGASSAPIYQIPPREVVAVEHPMIIKNIDKGLKTFGNGKPFGRIFHADDPEGSLPLYLRHNDPMCAPILSHYSPTSNVLLKITVPKRTGKRKRGSQDTYSEVGPNLLPTGIGGPTQNSNLCSHSRNDSSAQLLRTLRDNADKYQVEAVAEIERTHRFRALTDFHHSTTHTEFSTKFQEFVLPGEVEKMRQFKFNPSRGWKKNEEFMPPPAQTNQTLPFNWGWHQNSQIEMNVNEKAGEAVLTNNSMTRRIYRIQYITPDVESIPESSPFAIPEDPNVCEVILKLTEALDERPVWTQRALGNRIGHEGLPVPIAKALHHVGYQFKGGPFRDAVIKYGVDPRTDKKYRKFQTLFFEFYGEEERVPLKPWRDVRTGISLDRNGIRRDTLSHIFNGKSLIPDGKIWQLCDITDPLLVHLINNAPLREEYDAKSDGYFSNGSWAKIHAIMRTKLSAIQAHVNVSDLDFAAAINVPDVIEDNKKESHRIPVPVPDIRSTDEARVAVDGGKDPSFIGQSGITKYEGKLRDIGISQKLGQVTQKRKYIINESLERGGSHVVNDAETTAKKGEEGPDQDQMISNEDHKLEGRATSNNSTQVRQPNTPCEEYLTAEENVNGAEGELEDDEDDGGGLKDDDSAEGEEEGESENEEGEEDDQGSGDEDGPDGRGDSGSGEEDEDYDSETTDVVDAATCYKPQSRPQSRS